VYALLGLLALAGLAGAGVSYAVVPWERLAERDGDPRGRVARASRLSLTVACLSLTLVAVGGWAQVRAAAAPSGLLGGEPGPVTRVALALPEWGLLLAGAAGMVVAFAGLLAVLVTELLDADRGTGDA